MTITLIIIGYILNVFLNRWLNYIIYTKHRLVKIPFIWFCPLIPTIALIYIIVDKYFENENWFTGKYWNK
jgi:hypothetical protein